MDQTCGRPTEEGSFSPDGQTCNSYVYTITNKIKLQCGKWQNGTEDTTSSHHHVIWKNDDTDTQEENWSVFVINFHPAAFLLLISFHPFSVYFFFLSHNNTMLSFCLCTFACVCALAFNLLRLIVDCWHLKEKYNKVSISFTWNQTLFGNNKLFINFISALNWRLIQSLSPFINAVECSRDK